MAKRATLEEVREFANKVREAGGGNPIDALMPAVPEEPESCLIARNLNFNCTVNNYTYGAGNWYMALDDPEVRDRIAENLGLEAYDRSVGIGADYCIKLPPEIGQVAADFDRAGEIVNHLVYEAEYGDDWYEEHGDNEDATTEDLILHAAKNYSEDDLKLAKEMLPYIEESRAEAYDLATIITDEGKIVL